MASWQDAPSPFDPHRADENGLVALGGSLHPDLVLVAYRSGVFPWSSKPVITWWSPDPRCIFDLETWKAHRSVGKSIRREGWTFSIDRAFSDVMHACAEPDQGRESTWITEDFLAAYQMLHRRGHAHSVEVWEGDELVGGLYGVTIGGFFGGESMFKRRTDASKAAVLYLIERLRASGFALCDAQVPTEHLHRLGAIDIERRDYLERLQAAMKLDARLS